ncbi:collagen binding domain-containing protein [Butyrivibrio sp. WCE2006]|uniref:collagen binding domain-containing protein n=1 Tax=Butyrivibrio sp. WCE2006 TaxID=1410611 RepID=UPI0005D17557|nr:collagen binding domain-containing protein [Butyrivibrio sp. WCE2006]
MRFNKVKSLALSIALSVALVSAGEPAYINSVSAVTDNRIAVTDNQQTNDQTNVTDNQQIETNDQTNVTDNQQTETNVNDNQQTGDNAESTLYTRGNSIIDRVEATVNGNSLENNSEIGFDDKIKFTYHFTDLIGVNFPEDEAKGNVDLNEKPFVTNGQKFTLAIDNTVFTNIGNIEIPAITYGYEVDGKTYTFAKVSMYEDSVLIEIVDDNPQPHIIENANFGYEVSFSKDSDNLQNKEKYELNVCGVKYSIILKDNKKNPPTMKANGFYNNLDEVIDWTVDITNDPNPKNYEKGYNVNIVIPEDQIFVENTMSINGEVSTVNIPEEGNILLNLSKEQTEQNNKITFKTKPSDNVYLDLQKESFKNNNGGDYKNYKKELSIKAEIVEGEVKVKEADAKVNITKDFGTWITKGNGEIDENGKAAWEVTINTNGYSFNALTLYDKFNTDSRTTMSLDGSVVVKKIHGKSAVTPGNSENAETIEIDNPSKDSSCDFLINLGDISSEISTIVVTYNTIINDYENFQSENHEIPSNKAWLSYKTGSGEGITSASTPEVDIRGLTVKPKAGIDKRAVRYDKDLHRITWEVVANKNKKTLTNAKIEDTVGEGQKLVSINEIKVEDSSDVLTYLTDLEQNFSNQETEYTIDFGDNLNGKTVTFYVVTEITDKSLWSSNIPDKTPRKFTNTVKLFAGRNNDSASENPIASDENPIASDVATNERPYTFVTMKSTPYNYDTHYIDYEIKLKSGKIGIKNVVLTDKLDEKGLEYVEDANHKLTVEGDTDTEYTYENGMLTVKGLDFVDDDSDKTMKFTAKVTDEKIRKIENGKSRDIENSVNVKTEDNATDGVTVSATNKVNNIILTKSGEKIDGLARFTVKVNGGKLPLKAGTAIKDVMGKSFELVEDSVHIYTATVNKGTGELTKGAEYKDVIITSETAGDNPVLNVKFNKDTSDAYILEYTASPEYPERKDYVNNVKLVSSSGDDMIGVNYTGMVDVFSGAKSTGVNRFVLTVSDAKTNEKIPDVTYGVYEDKGDEVSEKLYTVKTGNNGLSKLFNKLDLNKKYYLLQESAPDGYWLDLETRHYVVSNGTTFELNLQLTKKADMVVSEPVTKPKTETESENAQDTNQTPGFGIQPGNGPSPNEAENTPPSNEVPTTPKGQTPDSTHNPSNENNSVGLPKPGIPAVEPDNTSPVEKPAEENDRKEENAGRNPAEGFGKGIEPSKDGLSNGPEKVSEPSKDGLPNGPEKVSEPSKDGLQNGPEKVGEPSNDVVPNGTGKVNEPSNVGISNGQDKSREPIKDGALKGADKSADSSKDDSSNNALEPIDPSKQQPLTENVEPDNSVKADKDKKKSGKKGSSSSQDASIGNDSETNAVSTDNAGNDPNAASTDNVTNDSSDGSSADVAALDRTADKNENPANDAASEKDKQESRGTLAKTGGFFGTVFGYLTGLLLIIGGAVIVFKKRKEK